MVFDVGRFRKLLWLQAAALALAIAPHALIGIERDKPIAPYGLEKRTAWTTSRVVGSPDPAPPLRAVRAFAKLSFANPLYIIAEPGGERLTRFTSIGSRGPYKIRSSAVGDV